MLWVLLVHLILSTVGRHEIEESHASFQEDVGFENSILVAENSASHITSDRRVWDRRILQGKDVEEDAENEANAAENGKEDVKKEETTAEPKKDEEKKTDENKGEDKKEETTTEPKKEEKKDDQKKADESKAEDKKEETTSEPRKDEEKKDEAEKGKEIQAKDDSKKESGNTKDSQKESEKKEEDPKQEGEKKEDGAKKENSKKESEKKDDSKKETEKKDDSKKEGEDSKKEGEKKEESKKESEKKDDSSEDDDNEKEEMKKKIEKLKKEAKKAKRAQKKAEKAKKKAQKDAKKQKKKMEMLDDETKQILSQKSNSDVNDFYPGSLKFPVLAVARGYVVDISKEKDPGKLTNTQLSLMRSAKQLQRATKFAENTKECPVKEKTCKCGFKSMFWAYVKFDDVEDFCYGITGVCAPCDTSEKMVAIGFDYNYDKQSKKAEVTFVGKPLYDNWFAGHIPLYKYACNEGYVITTVKNKYEFPEKQPQQDSGKKSDGTELPLDRAHEQISITCGKLNVGAGEVKWYNCFTTTKWTKKKRKWCREVRKDANYDKGGKAKQSEKQAENPNMKVKADEGEWKRNLCEDVREIGPEKKSCAERMAELKEHFQIDTCPKSLRAMCPLSCGTCCGNNPVVKDVKGEDTKKDCDEHVAELKKAGQSCTDLIKGQCPHACGLCKMPGEDDKSSAVEESLSIHQIPAEYSYRLAYALSFFLILFGFFVFGCIRSVNDKGEDLYVEFSNEDVHEHFIDSSHASA